MILTIVKISAVTTERTARLNDVRWFIDDILGECNRIEETMSGGYEVYVDDVSESDVEELEDIDSVVHVWVVDTGMDMHISIRTAGDAV